MNPVVICKPKIIIIVDKGASHFLCTFHYTSVFKYHQLTLFVRYKCSVRFIFNNRLCRSGTVQNPQISIIVIRKSSNQGVVWITTVTECFQNTIFIVEIVFKYAFFENIYTVSCTGSQFVAIYVKAHHVPVFLTRHFGYIVILVNVPFTVFQ